MQRWHIVVMGMTMSEECSRASFLENEALSRRGRQQPCPTQPAAGAAANSQFRNNEPIVPRLGNFRPLDHALVSLSSEQIATPTKCFACSPLRGQRDVVGALLPIDTAQPRHNLSSTLPLYKYIHLDVYYSVK